MTDSERNHHHLVRIIRETTPGVLLGLPGLAAYCHVDECTALRWIESGRLPMPQLFDAPTPSGECGIWRWRRPAIDEWAAGGCRKCTPPTEEVFSHLRRDFCAERLCSRMIDTHDPRRDTTGDAAR